MISRRVKGLLLGLLLVTLVSFAIAIQGVRLGQARIERNVTQVTNRVTRVDAVISRSPCTNRTRQQCLRILMASASPADREKLRGPRGYRGRIGRTGATGARGPQGIPGAVGATGSAGLSIVGNQGRRGLPGFTGPQGNPGPQGPKGDPGISAPIVSDPAPAVVAPVVNPSGKTPPGQVGKPCHAKKC